MARKKFYVGVDLGGTKILAAVVDASGEVVSRVKDKTQAAEGVKPTVERVIGCVNSALESAGVERPEAVGVGVAGPVDVERGIVLTAGNMPWDNVPLAKMLRKGLGVETVFIDNDVNVGTYGEWRMGAGRKCDDLLGVFVGTGIGGGLILNDQLYRGHFHTAGEIGHTVINTGGGLTRRIMEDLASRSAMAVTLARRIATNHPSMLADRIAPQKIFRRLRSGLLGEAYAAGDVETVAVVHEAAGYIGTAAANAVMMLSLPLVVIGGGVTEALGGPFVERIADQLRRELFPADLPVKVKEAELGDDAGVIGAALLAAQAAEADG